MTLRDYTANVISASKVVPDGNFKDSKASGVWDINEALDLIKGGNWPNVANINPDTFVDALFQTHLYTGNNTSTAIDNGINLSGKGGMVWTKNRDSTQTHFIHDTLRGATKLLSPNDTNGEETQANSLTSFNSNGFTVNNLYVNNNGDDYVSWTFRKQPKFFDVVTYSGQNTDLALSHNLGVAPGMVIVKRYDTNGYDWYVYHRSLNLIDNLVLNSNGDAGQNSLWTSTSPTSTTFNLKGNTGAINQSGGSYVAYLFAHNNNDGGFGEPGDQDIIKCGSYTGNGSSTGPEIDLGFEPQLIIIKKSSGSANWTIVDTIRGIFQDVDHPYLQPNVNAQEYDGAYVRTLPTGFQIRSNSAQFNTSSGTYIYMAIRRGGMQTPSTASSVFSIDTKGSSAPYFDSNHIVDMALVKSAGATGDWYNYARLLGEKYLVTNSRAAQANASEAGFDFMNGHIDSDWGGTNAHSWMWKRARGYFDMVTWNVDGTGLQTINHNLGVAPEMIWSKNLDDNGSGSGDWWIGHTGLTGWDGANENDRHALKFTTAASAQQGYHKNLTATSMQLGGNAVGGYVTSHKGIAYLFATVAGVSKVGSYTGNGASDRVIDCGFTNGAKFVLIKDADQNGTNWQVFDTTRGLTSTKAELLRLNTTDAQIPNGSPTQDYHNLIEPDSSGFKLNNTSALQVNANSINYIFYAIANDPS